MLPNEAVQAAGDLILSDLAAKGSVCLSVASDSMRPVIEPGDLVTVHTAACSDFRPGDIVLVRSGAELLVHRLVAIRAGPAGAQFALTMGDRAQHPDQPVPLESVVGVVVAVERHGRRIPIQVTLLGRLRARLAPALCRISNSMRQVAYAMLPADRSGQDRLLLALSLPATDGQTDCLCPRPTMESEWNALAEAAAREGLAETIYYHQCRTSFASERVPACIRSRLAREYNNTLARNTLFDGHLRAVLGLLAGLDVVVLKGAWLAGRVYPSPGLRRYCDFDVLLRLGAVADADRRLRDAGYDCGPHSAAHAAVGGYINSLLYRNAAAGPALHLHWHLLNSILPRYANAHMDIKRVWELARSAGPALELCPEHAMIHLADHALRHSFDRLVLLRDIHEVISTFGGELDWDLLVADARRFGLNRTVWFGLELAARLVGTPVPPDALRGLMPGAPRRLERAFMRLASTGRRAPELCNLAYLGGSGSFYNAARYLFRTMIPPRAVLAAAYGTSPEHLGPGAYARRWGRGACLAARALLARQI